MNQSIPFHRRGTMSTRIVPVPLPDVLGNFPFPKKYADRIKAAAKVADGVYDAEQEWREAHDEWENFAPAKDQQALEAAIRAGEPDPGTPATDAADRAEHVAWTRLQLAIDDLSGTEKQGDVIREYLEEEAEHLAKHEIARKEAHGVAEEKAAAIMREVEAGSNKPGIASTTMKQYVATRWNDADDRDTLRTPNPGATVGQKRAVEEFNQRILDRWAREANGLPEPGYDVTQARAGELEAAADYGSTEARDELKRRRAASKPAARL